MRCPFLPNVKSRVGVGINYSLLKSLSLSDETATSMTVIYLADKFQISRTTAADTKHFEYIFL